MMKKTLMKGIVLVFMATVSMTMSAQDWKNSSYRKGYHADLSLETLLVDKYVGQEISVNTSHGYCWGNGLYVGGGTGVEYGFYGLLPNEYSIYVPVFAEIKYSFMNKLASPFVDFRGGALMEYVNHGTGFMVNPSVGVDIWNFSLRVGFEWRQCTYREYNEIKEPGSDVIELKPGSLMRPFLRFKIGLTYNF